MDAAVIRDQSVRACAVPDLDARALRRLRQEINQARSAARHFDGQAAPEAHPTVHLERLTSVHRRKSDTRGSHPPQRLEASLDEKLYQVGVAPKFGDPTHIVEKRFFSVSAEISLRDLRFRQIRNELLQIVDAAIRNPHRTGGESRVPAPLALRRHFEHQNARTGLARRQRGTQSRVACANDHHIKRLHLAVLASC